jgi:hypothetical protein
MNLNAPPRRFLWLLIAACVVASTAAAESTRIYIANDNHTDYMWTADAETYAGVFTDMLDYYLALPANSCLKSCRVLQSPFIDSRK